MQDIRVCSQVYMYELVLKSFLFRRLNVRAVTEKFYV